MPIRFPFGFKAYATPLIGTLFAIVKCKIKVPIAGAVFKHCRSAFNDILHMESDIVNLQDPQTIELSQIIMNEKVELAFRDELLASSPLLQGLQTLRRHWWCLLALGILLVTLGVISIGAPLIMTITTVMIFGSLLLIGGVAEIISAFWARQWSGFFLIVLGGVFHVSVGVIMLERPGLAAAGFTLMLAIFLVVGGLIRIIVSVAQRFPQWGWMTLGGSVALLMGLLIWKDWPEASLWLIGTFVGVDLVLNGLSWATLGLAIRKLPHIAKNR